jgi:C4-dicarboxylate transporter, DctM subunit
MNPLIFALIIFCILLFLILLGVPIAFALMATAMGGIYFFEGINGLHISVLTAWDAVASFTLICVPLYILLGVIFSDSGMAKRLYDGLFKWGSKLPGSMAIVTTVSCGLFAAISGSSVATAAIFAKIAIPSMIERDYNESIASGTVAAGGTLGILIPPSIPLILYGITVEQSIGKLFIAGVIPGMLLVILFSLYQIYYAKKYLKEKREEVNFSFREKIASLSGILPFATIMLIIIIFIYTGIATPTEAAAVSVIVSIFLAIFVYRTMNLKGLYRALKESVASSVMILFIIVGAMLFGYLLASQDIPQRIAQIVVSLGVSRWIVLLMINLFLIFLGMFLEVVSIIAITAPILVPIIITLGWDPIWFGIVMTINMEMALITPPVGLNLYVINNVIPDIKFSKILKGVIPYIIILAIMILLVVIFPDLAMWLPSRMTQ